MEENFITLIKQLLAKVGKNSRAEAKLMRQLNAVVKQLPLGDAVETQPETNRTDNAKKKD